MSVEVAEALRKVPLEDERQNVDDDNEGHGIEQGACVLQVGEACEEKEGEKIFEGATEVAGKWELTAVAKESDVIVIQDGHKPKGVPEEARDEPIVIDDS